MAGQWEPKVKDRPPKAEDQSKLTGNQKLADLYYGNDGVLYDKYGRSVNKKGVPYSSVGGGFQYLVTDVIDGRCNAPVRSRDAFPGSLCHKYRAKEISTCRTHQIKLTDKEMEEKFLALREKHLNSSDLYELDLELAGLKALIEMLTMQISKDPSSLTSTLLNSLGQATENLGKVRDRITRQNKASVITAEELRLYSSAVMSVMAVFTKPSDYTSFVNAVRVALTAGDFDDKYSPKDFGRYILLELPGTFDFDLGFRHLAEDLYRMRSFPLENLSLLEERLQSFREDDDDDPTPEMAEPDTQPMDKPVQTVLR